MATTNELLQALAESAAPLARELSLSLLKRPVPPVDQAPLTPNALRELYRELEELLAEAVPALEDITADMAECDMEEVDELFDDLSPPALDLVDMSRRIWQTSLPRETESLRPLLATLVEGPVTRLLELLLRIMHAVIDPWAVMEHPEEPVFAFSLRQEHEQNRAALLAWQRANPGILEA